MQILLVIHLLKTQILLIALVLKPKLISQYCSQETFQLGLQNYPYRRTMFKDQTSHSQKQSSINLTNHSIRRYHKIQHRKN